MKKYTVLLLIIMIGVFCYGHADAQTNQNPGEAFIEQATFEHNDAVRQFTSDFVTMFAMDFDAFDGFGDDSNVAIVNMFGNSNRSDVSQSGWGNRALVNILGDRNSTGVEQRGNSNRLVLNLEGSDNEFEGVQLGSDNSLRIDLIGSAQNQSFSQIGNNMSFHMIDNGNGSVPLLIEQRGNGASVIIENH